MGCFSTCCKKKRPNYSLAEPIFNEKTNKRDTINNDNNDIKITVNEEKSTDNTINEKEIKEDSKPETKKNYIIKENTIYSEKGLNLNENIDDDELLLREDSPLICDYEKNVITFTHIGFLDLLYSSIFRLSSYLII